MSAWKDISTAPKMRTILLFAITSTDPPNWKMATGVWCSGYDNHEMFTPWEWDGRQLRHCETQPTHWQPLPEPPSHPGAT